MNDLSPRKLYIALLHHPVKNKNGETIASAVTNLDLHDIARIGKTYGVAAFYVVTPLEDQKTLVAKIISHWVDGWGGVHNPDRREALALVRVRDSLTQVVDDIKAKTKVPVQVVATCATEKDRALRFDDFKDQLKDPANAYLLVFGTASGLADEVIAGADLVLESIKGNTGYNHLPVRAAVAIILDRLLAG
ncbi:MAG: RNA methyltransferase [Desulfosalsimonadaceae bacterium]